VQFTVEGSGTVSDARVVSTNRRNSKAESCIVGEIRTWRFPEREAGDIGDVRCSFTLEAP
jgi:hypothetical protein